jgi:ankyrin repeat protein
MMHICAEYGKLELFEFFVKELKGNVMAKNHADETPFIVAAKEGRANIVKLYIE